MVVILLAMQSMKTQWRDIVLCSNSLSALDGLYSDVFSVHPEIIFKTELCVWNVLKMYTEAKDKRKFMNTYLCTVEVNEVAEKLT